MFEDLSARPFVDPAGLVAFWREAYLESYVRDGGASVKWLRGSEGSGKSRVLLAVEAVARDLGYVTARIDAGAVPLGRFAEIYRAVMRDMPIERRAEGVARQAARSIGAGTWDPAARVSAQDHLLWEGRPVGAVEEDLARCLDFLYASHELEPPVAAAARRLALPYLTGSEGARADAASAARWLRGERLPAAERRRTGIYLTLDRYSARDVLRSLLTLMRMCGMPGMVWTVAGLERLLVGRLLEAPAVADGPSPLPAPASVRYTAARRLDAYEGMRELIDDAGSLPGLFVVYAGRPEAFEDEHAGLITYPALALRVQTEVESDRPNPYNDRQDLDRLWQSDWPSHQRSLVAAYRPDASMADIDLQAALATAHVSPVRRLVELLTHGGGGEGYSDA